MEPAEGPEAVESRERRTRVGVYAVCVSDGRILLSRYKPPNPRWSLPGGGLDHGEHPVDGLAREVAEETGYQIRIERLLGTDSAIWPLPDVEIHAVNLLYEATVIGGRLQHEVNGSSDRADWIELTDLHTVVHTHVTDLGLALLDSTNPAAVR